MPKDTAGSAVWTIGKLVGAAQEDPAVGVRIEIPRFQRHLVWSNDQRRELIDSIHRGYPIGSILLFKRPNPSGPMELYQVVDGLQRTSTLLGYMNEPLVFAPVDLFPEGPLKAIANATGSNLTDTRRAIDKWMREVRALNFKAGFSPERLTTFLLTELGAPSEVDSEDVLEAASEGLDGLKASVDISSVSIPVVTYSGPEGELPEIFERINQSGTKLNKYEVFAATWLNTETQVSSENIRVAINEKYNALISRGFTISGLEADKAIQDFNLFEYLFGLGKTLVKDQTLLFSARSDPAEAEPSVFALACAVRGLQLARMSELPDHMNRAADGVIDPSKMESAVLQASQKVSDWLRPYIALKLNSSTDSADIAHGELQIVSMIARAVAGRWDSQNDWAERPGWEKDWTALQQAMPQHYLLDILQETWRGPIYSTLFSRVWDTDDGGVIQGPSNYYSRTVDGDDFTTALDAWFGKQLAREQRSRPYIRASDRLFLRYVYTGLVSHLDNAAKSFELEHLFPVSRLRSEIPAESPGWPISCISNLALFTKSMNREKSAQTISEFLSKNEVSPTDQELLEKLLLCEPSDVAIPDSGLTRDQYVEFLKARWVTMRTVLLKALKVADS